MDFDKTSFSVDWYTPGDKYAPKRLSFPKSARISIDDLVPDSPLSFCFSPVDGTIPLPRTYSFVDTPLEAARGWPNSAPPSPLVPLDHEQSPMYDQDPKQCEENPRGDWRALATPGVLSVADDCALSGVVMDVSCLDTLDEELLLSPVGCFTELCWAAAVTDEVTAPVASGRRSTRSRARSFKRDDEPSALPPFPRDYPGGFEYAQPLSARITLPLDKQLPRYPSSPSCDSHDASSIFQDKKPVEFFREIDVKGPSLPPLPVQAVPMPRRPKKRDVTPPVERCTPSQPSTPRLRPSKSSQTLRAISEAYSTWTRARRKSPTE